VKSGLPYQFQTFYNYWCDHDRSFPETFPSVLSLGTKPPVGSLPGDKILVTEAYEALYRRLVEMRASGGYLGVVITGQPGIGASKLSVLYLLRWLNNTSTIQESLPSCSIFSPA
jgi:hypothetical protein